MLQVNADDLQREALEAQRKYREQYASQYTAGYTDAEDKLNPIIEDLTAKYADVSAQKDDLAAQNVDLVAQNADLTAQKTDLMLQLEKYKSKYGEMD